MPARLSQRPETLRDGHHRLLLTDGRRAFVKRWGQAPPDFFAAEADGLGLLAVANGLRVPQVHWFDDAVLVLEDLGDGQPASGAWARAGRALARQHASQSPVFGLDRDGWCGRSPQANTPMRDGWRFFAHCRLWPQASRAHHAGLLSKDQLATVERVCANLPTLVPRQPAALVHGDLWRANLHACANGELAVVDAGAVHYGWAEADLAMLLLFAEPPAEFFSAYHEASGIAADWRTRAPVYNLYHLLNHLNLFGGGYAQAVADTLRRL